MRVRVAVVAEVVVEVVYRRLGFRLTGEEGEGETVGVLDLTHPM